MAAQWNVNEAQRPEANNLVTGPTTPLRTNHISPQQLQQQCSLQIKMELLETFNEQKYILCCSRFGGQRDAKGTKANGRSRPATWTAKCCSRRSTRGQLRTLLATLQFPFSSRCLSTKNDVAFKWIRDWRLKAELVSAKWERNIW